MVRTTTDSGSNFIKAISVFGEQSQNEKAESESESDQDSSEEPKADYLDTLSILVQDNGLEYCHIKGVHATC